AINVSMAALTASTTASQQTSDLPLRNYPCAPEPVGDSTPDVPPAAMSQSTSVLPTHLPETPCSMAAEYGEGVKDTAPPAAVIAENIFRVYSGESRSRSEASSHRRGRVRGPVRSSTPTPTRSPSAGRSRPRQRGELSPAAQTLNEKVQRFLRSMNTPSPTEELMKENRSLHQRVAALQRTELDLLNDNQDLAPRLASTQKRQETRRRQWKEELLNREKVFEARIKDLELRLARQEAELMRVALERTRETTALSDNAITSWFATKASAWRGWAEDFAHQDPNRVRSGLHPLQLRELCEGVKPSVRLTDKGELPEGLLTPTGNDGVHTAQVLLQGMLANFISSEVFKSPFWVFNAISVSTLELESPSVPRLNSPIGFRMDLAMWNSDVALPWRRQRKAWRSSLMKAFCDGGMSTPVYSILLTEDARALAEARLRYAGRLKDNFLRSPARFLLQDQDAAGIEKLERRLLQEIDAALRFSCQLWCRRDPIFVKGLDELADMTFNAASDNMELCQAQAPLYAQHAGSTANARDAPPGYHDGHSVVMVVQPSIGVKQSVGNGKGAKDSIKAWVKASVLVAPPKPVQQAPAAAQKAASPPKTVSMKAILPPPAPPKNPKEQALILLPTLTFKGPQPLLLKQPAGLSMTLLEQAKVL
ncbi:hypothetical protein C8A03DRAFT_18939, partial [Achaetomium macrosporum]